LLLILYIRNEIPIKDREAKAKPDIIPLMNVIEKDFISPVFANRTVLPAPLCADFKLINIEVYDTNIPTTKDIDILKPNISYSKNITIEDIGMISKLIFFKNSHTPLLIECDKATILLSFKFLKRKYK